MKNKLFIALTLILFVVFSASIIYGKTKFRGVVTGKNPDGLTVVVDFYGNPDLRVGGTLYAHDMYEKVKAELVIVDVIGESIVAKVNDDKYNEIECGNFVADYPPMNARSSSFNARYSYKVNIKYQKEPNFYDVFVDKTFDFDNYISFRKDNGKLYKIDILSVEEVGVAIDKDRFYVNTLVLKDKNATADEKLIYLANTEQDKFGWEDELITQLKALEVVIENKYVFTWKNIVSILINKRGKNIPLTSYIRDKYLIDEETFQKDIEDAQGDLSESAKQTEEIIYAYPVIFKFDQFKRAILEIKKLINKEIQSEAPDLEKIVRLSSLLESLKENFDKDRIAKITIIIDHPEAEPIVMDEKDGVWQARVNLTAGKYKYKFKVELKSKPCNEILFLDDPLKEGSEIEVFSLVVPVQIKEKEVDNSSEEIK